MLTEERHEKIMRLVNTSGAVSVQDLVSFLNISESTVRRDLLTLDREGRLRRVRRPFKRYAAGAGRAGPRGRKGAFSGNFGRSGRI